ncbi:probable serine/threonine-protein kinase kinX isoform X2 [Scophthalmus maximus]|uniref:probable serine/threonine-protein kinase kinX isoform X2 n=1 Tax=Scophthalmus maximus TaxID=52904 RepID=UPI001FA8BC5B|nr:probable serine/threonine-protein kinase kinX isoform X2 [Scophthalmus maximus]
MDNLDFSDEDFFRHLPKGDHERPLHLLRLSSKCDSDTDSYTSVPDTQGRRFIKRKVLRKHKGEPHVCDESFYIEDSDSASFTGKSSEDGNYDDGDGDDEDEDEEIERVVKEKEAEHSLIEASGEEKPEVTDQENVTGQSSEDGSDEEEEVEEDEAIEQVVKEEVTISVPEAEDSLLEASEEEKENFTIERSEDGSDEEEEEIIEQMVKEESKLSAESEDSLQETSDEEKPELNSQENFTGQSSEDGSDDEEDEDEEIEQVVKEEDTKPVAGAEDSIQEASEEEKPEVNIQENFTGESSRGGSDDDGEGNCTSSCSSPALSRMTSGYGTYRPEEQGRGDYRDDHTITEFDQDSRGDVSEMRDKEEDDRSLSSFGGFDIVSTREPVPEPNMAQEEVDVAETKPTDDLLMEDLRAETNETSEGQQQIPQQQQQQQQPHVAGNQDAFLLDEKSLEDGRDREEGRRHKELDEEAQDLKEDKDTVKVAEDKVESEDPDECSSNKDIEFIDSKVESDDPDASLSNKDIEVLDSKVESDDPDECSSNKDVRFTDSKEDVSWMTYDIMSEEWEENLREKKDSASCLEEGLSKLHLSTSTQPDFDTENSTSPSDSPANERLSLSAFESYIRDMIDTQSDGDHRPKSKSFIRPVISQHTIKKTDPVAKYFQYKHHWDRLKLPGERDRRALRCEIKERLAYQPPPPKPRRVYVPNTYVVPTEKKRPALCWKIRSDLANGIAPSKFNY